MIEPLLSDKWYSGNMMKAKGSDEVEMDVSDVSRASVTGMEHGDFQDLAGLMNSGGGPCRDAVVEPLHVSLRRVPRLVVGFKSATTCLQFPNFL